MLAISIYFNLTGLLSFHSINGNEEKGLSQSLFFNYQMFWKLYLSEYYFSTFQFPPPLSTYYIHFENYSEFEQVELKTLAKKCNQKQQILLLAMLWV